MPSRETWSDWSPQASPRPRRIAAVERPALDVNPGTNQVLPPDLTPDSWTVVPDWDAEDPTRRYTMRMQPPGPVQPGWCMTSAHSR